VSAPIGIAVDLGTSSVALAASTDPGRVFEARNAQAADFGRDILSRLSAAQAGHSAELRDLAQNQVLELMAEAGVDAGKLEGLVVAGNSAMAALFVGADVTTLATAPFAPVRDLRCENGPLTDLISPDRITVLEPIDAFVGGDLRADLVTAGLTAGSADPQLLIDLGTNAEVVLATAGRLHVCSAPAGPAFEGGGFKLRGSQLLADVADFLRRGLLATDGKFAEGVQRDAADVAYLQGERSGQAISQRFVRDLQLAKAATSTAIARVLAAAATPPEDLSRIVFAGAFGTALDPADLVTLGLIPEIWQDRCRSIGNGSLSGALAVLGGADPEISAAISPVELPTDPAFNAALIAATDFSWN